MQSTIFAKVRVIVSIGNSGVHDRRPPKAFDALTAVKELFHVGYWLARNYARTASRCRLSPLIRRCGQGRDSAADAGPSSELALDLEVERQARLSAEEARQSVDAELARLREELARAKAANEARPTPRLQRGRDPRLLHRPAAARGRLAARQARDREFRVEGMPNNRGQGLRRLRAVGRRRQAARARRGQAHPQGCAQRASSRPSSTPIAWRSSTASGR